MILQILLTIVFGFGVLTLATVALLNAAGHRLHDGKRLKYSGGKVQFMYKYPNDKAEKLRIWFARLPVWLGIAATTAVISAGVLYVCAGPQPQLPPNEPDASHLSSISIITWVGMGLYVLALVVVTTVLSWRLYAVLRDVEQVKEKSLLDDAMAEKLYAKIGKLVVELEQRV